MVAISRKHRERHPAERDGKGFIWNDAIAAGRARGPRAVFGGAPKTSSERCDLTKQCEPKWADEVFGGPSNTAGRRPALPGLTASFGSISVKLPSQRGVPFRRPVGRGIFAGGAVGDFLQSSLCYHPQVKAPGEWRVARLAIEDGGRTS